MGFVVIGLLSTAAAHLGDVTNSDGPTSVIDRSSNRLVGTDVRRT
jgi:hypothetical protein